MTTVTHARTAVSTIARRATWLVTARRTAAWMTRRLASARTATRCTCRCPPTACTFARTARVARVRTVASVSVDPGCYKAIFVLTPGRSLSSVRSVARPSPTSRICERTSRLIRSRNHSCVAAAPRHSPSSRTYTSTKSRRACVASATMQTPIEVTELQLHGQLTSDVRSETPPTKAESCPTQETSRYKRVLIDNVGVIYVC